MEEINININPLLYLILIVILCVVVKYIIPLIKSNTSYQQMQNVKNYAGIAVYAVEQMIGAGKGELKLDEATKMVIAYINRRGYQLNEDMVRELIEAAVFAMNMIIKVPGANK